MSFPTYKVSIFGTVGINGGKGNTAVRADTRLYKLLEQIL